MQRKLPLVCEILFIIVVAKGIEGGGNILLVSVGTHGKEIVGFLDVAAEHQAVLRF